MKLGAVQTLGWPWPLQRKLLQQGTLHMAEAVVRELPGDLY